MEMIKAIANDIAELVEKKNHDYGGAFDQLLDEYPEYFVIRLTEKLNRLKTLQKNEAKVKSESFDDTVRDIIGYSLLYLNRQEQITPEDLRPNLDDFVGVDLSDVPRFRVAYLGNKEDMESCILNLKYPHSM